MALSCPMNPLILLLLLAAVPLLALAQPTATPLPALETTISGIRELLSARSFVVKWKLTQDDNFRINAKVDMVNQQSDQRKRSSSTFNFFEPSAIARQGSAIFDADQSGVAPSSLYVELYDGDYSTNSTVVLQIPLDDSMDSELRPDHGYTLWSNNRNNFITCLLFRQQTLIGKFNLEAKYEIFTNIRADLEVTARSKVELNFYSNSFVFWALIEPVTSQYDSLAYLSAVCTLLFLGSVVFFKPRRSVYNLSQWMIVQVVAFVLVANLVLFGHSFLLLDTLLWVVAVCSLANIALSLFFLRNYEDVVWNEFRHRTRALYLLVYLAVYFLLAAFYWKSKVFWIYQGFLLLAVQISYAYSKGGRGGMAIKLLVTIILTRAPFIYYSFLMEELTRLENSPSLLFTFIAINILLLTFIALQRYFGSRFLIPKELIPDYFNYFPKDIELDVLKEECPICSQALADDPDKKTEDNNSSFASNADSELREAGSQLGQASLSQESSRRPSIMVTPCDHKFHPKCLQDWMDKRLNCPICRTALSPSQQQFDDSYCC